MKASVVIVTRNRQELVDKLKKQIVGLDKSLDLIIIDQTLTTPNLCDGRNQGISKSKNEVIIFFDDDVEITKDTIRAHLSEYTDPKVVGVAGRVINDGEQIPKNTDVVCGQVNPLLTNFTKNFWSTKRQIVSHVYGCNMSFRKTALETIGGFDTKLPPPLSSFEEIDLSFRIRKLGSIQFAPDALVYHHRAKTGGTRLDIGTRNHLYYQSYGRLIQKHLLAPSLLLSILILLIRMIKETPNSIFYFFKGLFS